MELTASEVNNLWCSPSVKNLYDDGYKDDEWEVVGSYWAPYHNVTAYRGKQTGEIRIDSYSLGD